MVHFRYFLLILFSFYSQVNQALVFNQPYDKKNPHQKILTRVLSEPASHFDPQEAYDSTSVYLVEQIYERLYYYPYLTQNYELEPLLAEKLPQIQFFNQSGKEISPRSKEPIVKAIYTIPIKKNIFYQPHPAFCHHDDLKRCQGQRREMIAEDFVYAFKRTANKKVDSPIISLLSRYVEGYQEYIEQAQTFKNISGVRARDRYTLEITTKGYYAQFIYWLSMCLLSPIPYEADIYYQKKDDKDAWRIYSIGTGPYMLFDNHYHQKMRMIKNPNYRQVYFTPPNGIEKEYILNQGKRLPLTETIDYYYEKETIPRWNKFLQGYYDFSTIPSESFEKLVWRGSDGQYHLSQQLERAGARIKNNYQFNISGIAFNMNDRVLGTYSEKNRLLRQAISIAFDYLEYINIFQNAYSKEAQGPLPQPLLDKERLNGFNSYIFNQIDGKVFRKDIQYAKYLLKKAGYPNGIDPITQKPLVLSMDVESGGRPYEKAIFSWYRKQLQKLGIQLNLRENDKNRMNYLRNHGLFQMTDYAWTADYPDSENFFMLFYSKNSSKNFYGPNVSNYSNPEYDEYFEKLQTFLSPPEKRATEKRLYQILIKDCVWVWGNHMQNLYLFYNWVDPVKNSPFISGLLQYYQVHPALRVQQLVQRNQAQFLPLILFLSGIFLLILPFVFEWKKYNSSLAKRIGQ